jgi:hypothetical protein
MESFLKNPFQNPFGGAMNPSGGGGGGVLEQIQEQVNTNGETLQSLQGGIGGLPSGNLPFGGIGGDIYSGHRGPGSPGTPSPVPIVGKQQEGMPVGNVTAAPNDINNPPSSITDAATDIDTQLRAEYDELVASAKKTRAEGFAGRMVLPGENLSFEEFKTNQPKPGMPFNMLGGPMQSDIFNFEKAEQNPGMDYSQFTPMMGQLQPSNLDFIGDGVQNTGVSQPGSIFSQTLDNYVPTDLFGANGEQGFFNQSSLSEPPRLPLRGGMQNNQFNQQIARPGLDPLFGRAFAGKPV